MSASENPVKGVAADASQNRGLQPIGDGNLSELLSGVLSVQVGAPPIVAGTRATVTLVIRNPFPENVIIDTIEAPSSEPLLPRGVRPVTDAGEKPTSLFQRFLSRFSAIRVGEVTVGPLVARFPSPPSRTINVELDPKSKLIVQSPFPSHDQVNIRVSEGAEMVWNTPKTEEGGRQPKEERVIPAHQEDIASFELRTAH